MSAPLNTVLIATKNKGKLREFASLFAALHIEVRSLADVPELPDIEETGATFAENALLKARAVAEWTGLPVLADDSGLCVDRLGGAPGVYSARYGGEHGNDARNNAHLLSELHKLSDGADDGSFVLADGTTVLSAARFVCALALYISGEEQLLVEGTCEGFILPERRGSGGFGYDPLFYVANHSKTMAELTPEEKNQISHRSVALRHLLARLT